MIVAGRTQERASALAAELGAVPISPSNLGKELLTTNIVVTCSGAPHRVLSVGQVKHAVLRRPDSPLVIIDIAVPRNVEPAVSRIRNVFLYNIDDLIGLANSNRQQRENEIQKATQIIADELDKFVSWWQEFKVWPIVSALTKKAEAIRFAQLNKTLKKLPPLSDEERDSLNAMTKSIVTKILNDPIRSLKANGTGNYAELVREIFRLYEENRR